MTSARATAVFPISASLPSRTRGGRAMCRRAMGRTTSSMAAPVAAKARTCISNEPPSPAAAAATIAATPSRPRATAGARSSPIPRAAAAASHMIHDIESALLAGRCPPVCLAGIPATAPRSRILRSRCLIPGSRPRSRHHPADHPHVKAPGRTRGNEVETANGGPVPGVTAGAHGRRQAAEGPATLGSAWFTGRPRVTGPAWRQRGLGRAPGPVLGPRRDHRGAGQGLASRTRLSGVSAARRNLV